MIGQGKFGETHLHPFGLIAVLILGTALFLVPRRFAVYPMIMLACIVPSAQRLVVGGLDFSLLRIMVLFGWTRLLARNEFKSFSWNRLDTAFLSWMLSGTIIYVIQQGDPSALVNRLGWMFDGCGMYFLFRCVLCDWQDLDRMVYCFAVISIPVAMAFWVEYLTGRNLFAFLGGLPQITMIRDGRLRCQGAFAHPILAGCFWASVAPFMVAAFISGRKRMAVTGLLASVGIIVACSSSTPLMSFVFGMLGLALYKIRKHMGYVRVGFLCSLVFLHLLMDKPVWHLMARANAVGGSTGWHRFKIMDATINNFSKWALLGERDPLSWGVWEMRDVTNQYIVEALRGGLLTLILFITVLTIAFRMVGEAVRSLDDDPSRRLFVWCIGVALFVHVGSFYGISYFGQIIVLVYLTLASIGSLPGATSFAPPVTEAPVPMPSRFHFSDGVRVR